MPGGRYQGLYGLIERGRVYRKRFGLGIAASIGSNACVLLVPYRIKCVIDAIASARATPDAIRNEALLIAALAVASAALQFCSRHFIHSAARRVEVDLRQQLLSHALSLPAIRYRQLRSGETMALSTYDLSGVRAALGTGVSAIVDAILISGAAAVLVTWLDPILAAALAVMFVMLGLAATTIMRRAYDRFLRVTEAFQSITEKAQESVAAMPILRAYTQDEGDTADFDRYNNKYYQHSKQYMHLSSLLHPIITTPLLTGLTTAVWLGVDGSRVVRGQLGLGSFAAVLTYATAVVWPMLYVNWMVSLVQRGAASMQRIMKRLSTPPEVQDGCRPELHGAIEARGLTFAYPLQDGTRVPSLTEISFQIPVGGTLGIVGEVGSGKSTVSALLTRVYDPPRGTLFVDGVDVTEIAPAHLRTCISQVLQEPFLFSESIADNLRLGNPHAGDADLQGVCELAALHGEILDFPRGYNTMLGERGISLSVGQKQRLSLARALLKPAAILILDDTLSALDARLESRVLSQLSTFLSRAQTPRTAIIIAHRISAVRSLDWILVLRDGRVVEEGRHSDLMQQAGPYRELYELQRLEGEAVHADTSPVEPSR